MNGHGHSISHDAHGIPGIRQLVAAAFLVASMLSRESRAQYPEPCLCTRAPRNLFLYSRPEETVSLLHVAGGATTTILLPSAVDPGRTKLQAADGRFELMTCGRSIVLLPLHDLAYGEHFPFLIALQDGTEIPLSVTAARNMLGYMLDAQVNILVNAEEPSALQKRLQEKWNEVEALQAENNQLREEATSTDHALAGLLANGNDKLTPFRVLKQMLLREGGFEIKITTFEPRESRLGLDKVAVTFSVTNRGSNKSWTLEEARLATVASGQARPFALRAFPPSIPPGGSGRIAIVAAANVLRMSAEAEKVAIELFRDGGLRQLHVELVTMDGPRLAIVGHPQLR